MCVFECDGQGVIAGAAWLHLREECAKQGLAEAKALRQKRCLVHLVSSWNPKELEWIMLMEWKGFIGNGNECNTSFEEFFYKGMQRNRTEPGRGCQMMGFFFKMEKIVACSLLKGTTSGKGETGDRRESWRNDGVVKLDKLASSIQTNAGFALNGGR